MAEKPQSSGERGNSIDRKDEEKKIGRSRAEGAQLREGQGSLPTRRESAACDPPPQAGALGAECATRRGRCGRQRPRNTEINFGEILSGRYRDRTLKERRKKDPPQSSVFSEPCLPNWGDSLDSRAWERYSLPNSHPSHNQTLTLTSIKPAPLP